VASRFRTRAAYIVAAVWSNTVLMRPSYWLWLVAVVVLPPAACSLVLALAVTVGHGRSLPMDFDKMHSAIQPLFDAGAIDHAKAAPVIGLELYTGESASERQKSLDDVESGIVWMLADIMREDSGSYVLAAVSIALLAAVVGFIVSMLIGWQAWRVSQLEGEIQLLRER
jgi:hypothetical protein